MLKSIISIKQMNFSYKNHLVLEDINGDFYGKKVYLLIGENGCGKSTFLKILQKSIQSYTGEVSISSLSYGMVGSTNFYDNLSGMDNIDYFLCNYNKEKLKNLINSFNMESYIHKRVKKYSLGMRQRLASVVVLLSDVRILLFDEPTNGMDFKAKQVFCNELLKLKEKDYCIIIASHNIDDFIEITDEIILIKDKNFNQVNVAFDKKYEIFFKEGDDVNIIVSFIQPYLFSIKKNSIVVNTEKISISELIRKLSSFNIMEVKEYKLNIKDLV